MPIRPLILLPLAALLASCVADNPRPPITGMSPPADPKPTRMVVTTYLPTDTNSNGYPDTIALRVHLFEHEGGWPLAVGVPGRFKFEMVSPQGKVLATWDLDPASSPGGIGRDQIGPCYLMDLSLLTDGRTDRIDAETIDLRGVFSPTKEPDRPIRATVSMHFGRTR